MSTPASDIEIAVVRDFWPHEPDRQRVALCPNCLVARLGAFAAPHASWCAIGRQVKQAESEASQYLVQI